DLLVRRLPLFQARCSFYSLPIPHPPRYQLFPYTTLFRSWRHPERDAALSHHVGAHAAHARSLDAASGPGRVARREGEFDHPDARSEEHTSELQSLRHLVCRLLLEKKNINQHRLGLRPDVA